MARRWGRWSAAVLLAAGVVAGGCAVPQDGDSGGGGSGGGLEIQYCEQDHRGELNESRCYDNPDGSR